MKKKILICLLIAVLALSSCVCSEGDTPSQFTTIEINTSCGYYIVYHKDTKVMYTVSKGDFNWGNFTLLVNPDGTPQLYDE
jgi:hypothetical protein